jgi:uncharacterized membrane protein
MNQYSIEHKKRSENMVSCGGWILITVIALLAVAALIFGPAIVGGTFWQML